MDFYGIFAAVIISILVIILLVVLIVLGIKMIIESVKNEETDCENIKRGIGIVFVQGIATSIDALSVGFTISKYNVYNAIVCAIIIAIITFAVCLIGVKIGNKFGDKYERKAETVG